MISCGCFDQPWIVEQRFLFGSDLSALASGLSSAFWHRDSVADCLVSFVYLDENGGCLAGV